MSLDEIERLERRLAGLHGQARTQPLLELGQKCSMYFLQTPSSEATRVYLEKGISALREGYGLLPAGDPHRAMTAGALGVLLAGRLGQQGGTEEERQEGVGLLEEALGDDTQTGVMASISRFMLGDLYMRRGMSRMQSPELRMRLMSGERDAEVEADFDRAAASFRAVLDGPDIAGSAKIARLMLDLIEVQQAVLGSHGPGDGGIGADLDQLAGALAKLQELQRSGVDLNATGSPFVPGSAFAKEWAEQENPVIVVREPDPGAGSEPTVTVAPIAPQKPDIAAMRAALRALLPEPGDLAGSIATLLRSDQAPERLDDLLSLAAITVKAAQGAVAEDGAMGPDEDAGAEGEDRLLLAAAQYLRWRRDGDGWGGEEDDDLPESDAATAASSLLAAAPILAAQRPDTLPTLLLLARLLPGDTLLTAAGHLSGLASDLRTIGADAAVLPEPVDGLFLDAHTGAIASAEEMRVSGPSAADAAMAQPSDRPLRRLVVVGGTGADWAGHGRFVVSSAASHSQLSALTRRRPRPVAEDAVFVVNPRGGREAAGVLTMVLRRIFYPRSLGLGRLIENADGAADAERVRASLGASILHLDCGVTAKGELELAEDGLLRIDGVAAVTKAETGALATGANLGSGLAILPPGCFLPLADHLLDAGFTGVVGWVRAVPDATAAAMLYTLHTLLVDEDYPPAEAVARVHDWPHESDRRLPPSPLPDPTGRPEYDPEDFSALAYRGR